MCMQYVYVLPICVWNMCMRRIALIHTFTHIGCRKPPTRGCCPFCDVSISEGGRKKTLFENTTYGGRWYACIHILVAWNSPPTGVVLFGMFRSQKAGGRGPHLENQTVKKHRREPAFKTTTLRAKYCKMVVCVQATNCKRMVYVCEQHTARGWCFSREILFLSPSVIKTYQKGDLLVGRGPFNESSEMICLCQLAI